MASSKITSELVIKLTEDATKQAPRIAEAIDKVQKRTKALQQALAESGTSDRLAASLARLGASETHVEGVARAMRDYAKAEGLAANAGEWTKAQAAGYRAMEDAALKAVRDIRREEAALAQVRRQEAARAEAEALRSAERIRDEKLRVAEAELRDQRRIAEAEVRLAQRTAHQREEAIARGGFGHFVATGAAAAVSAHGVVHGAESAVEKGAELQHTRIAMEQAGIDAATRKAIEDQALQLSARYGNVSQVAIMELAKEARSVLKDTKEVAPTTAVLAQAKSVLDANDRTGGQSEGLGLLVKGAESIGAAQDPERLAKLIDGYVKAIQVMGKTINPEQIYQFDKYLKAEGARVSDRFLMTTGLSLAQEMGGSTAGKDIAQTAKDIIGGFQNKHVPLKEMARIGMIDRGDIEWVGGKNGKLEAKGIKAGHKGIHGADLAASDLDLWVYKYLLPQMEKKGIKEQQKQLDFVTKVFTGTEADVISKLITQRSSFENHALLYGQAKGLAGTELNRQMAAAGLDALTKALGNLQANATSPAMGATGKALFGLADGINYLAVKAKEHPALAVTGAATATVAGLAGSGYLAYKMLNGFGLGTSATALTGSAGLLSEAAAAIIAAEGGKGAAAAAGAAGAGVAEGAAAAAGGLGLAATAGLVVLPATALTAYMATKGFGTFDPKKFADTAENRKATRNIGALPGVDEDEPAPPPIAGKRAGGGPVSGGKTYLVGEHGPELFTPGMNGAISTADVQRLLSKASFATRADSGDPATAKAVRAMAFELSGAVDGVARAIDRLDARDAKPTSFEAGVGDGIGAGRMSGGGRRSFGRSLGGGGYEDSGPRVKLGPMGSGAGGTGAGAKFAAKAPAIMGGLEAKYGLTKEQAAGVVGNLAHESAGFTAYHEGGQAPGSGGVGWAQWTGPRRKAFEAFAAKNKLDPTSDEASWRFLTEGDPETRAAMAAVKRTHTPAEAMKAFHDNFERSADWDRSGQVAKPRNVQSRIDYANRAMAMAETPGTVVPGSDPGPGGGVSSSKAVDVARGMIGMNDSAAAKSLHHYMHSGAWCADFVNGTLEKTGGKGTGNALAASFFHWGKQVDAGSAKAGDVMVSPHHVGFAEGPAQMHNGRMMVPMISGNHGHRVGESWEPLDKYQIRHGEAPAEMAKAKDDPLGLRRARESKAAAANGGEHGGDLHAGLAGLHGRTIRPEIDASSIHEAEAAIDRLHGKIDRIHTASAKVRSRNHEASRVAGLSSKLRGNYTSSGSQIG